ncbi:MAG: hypothetical protein SRB1_00629 [Desulfobacteraceae bacterium Eth-SRB1]|nr:MAG: hypothetical protein SRB1_00629 [Desulfobacteraceae bacterium Eth-SRB1]
MNLKMTRVIREMTQMELMKRSGVPQCRISHAEKGYLHLNAAEKQRIEKSLNMKDSIDWEEKEK